MSCLYIIDDGAVLSVDGGYYCVKYSDGDLKKIPSETLESVSLFGNISVTGVDVKYERFMMHDSKEKVMSAESVQQ